MQEETDISYGVVPLFKENSNWLVLLVHQISYRGDDFWILPKGHAENDESPLEAARRELKEEAGVENVEIDSKKQFDIQYSFVHENTKINKTVQYFIGYCQSKNIVINQPQEIKKLRWCSWEEADALATHKNSKQVLTDVKKYLEDQSQL